MRHLLSRLCTFAFVGVVLTAVTLAQSDVCPTIVQSVLDTADDTCSDVQRNQVCYVNLQAEITPQDPTVRLKFDQPGDLVNLEFVDSMIMTPLNTLENTWGVSLMKLQANLPDTAPGQNVTMLLFGDVEIRNEVTSNPQRITLPATSTTNANVRVAPSTSASVIKSLNINETIVLDGRNSDGTWVRLQLNNNESGWVFAELLTVDGDVMTLASVVAGEQAQSLTPMQAFYFKTGIGDSACTEAPESGIMIQTPSGGQKVNLTANGVDISLGSTAFLQAQPEQALSMAVVEGEGTLTANDVTVVVPAGSQSSVPLDENGEPAGPPEPATPYNSDHVGRLPVQSLTEDIDIADPLTQEEIDVIVEEITVPDVPLNDIPVTIPMIPGLSAECMGLINRLTTAATNNDINTIVALESEFINSGCQAEIEGLAERYETLGDEWADEAYDEEFDTGE